MERETRVEEHLANPGSPGSMAIKPMSVCYSVWLGLMHMMLASWYMSGHCMQVPASMMSEWSSRLVTLFQREL